MSRFKELFTHLGLTVDERLDSLRARLEDRFPADESPRIVPYRGHGTPDRLFVQGRVLRNPVEILPDAPGSAWDNFLATYRRYGSREVPGAQVLLHFDDLTLPVVTDHEGFFRAELTPPPKSVPPAGWRDVRMELAGVEQPHPPVDGSVLIPPPTAAFGVISDVDDTVLVTNAANLLRAAMTTFLENARSRLPFPGVASLYQALEAGPRGGQGNPIFYVSSSAWNLYDLLTDFMEFNDLPAGPLFLDDYGVEQGKLITSGHQRHKLAAIRHILQTHAQLPFVLFGDSGQKDPEIYAQVVDESPGRIRAVYIRDVTAQERDAQVEALARRVTAAGVPMLLVADSAAAAQSAAELDLLAASALPAIRAEVDQSF